MPPRKNKSFDPTQLLKVAPPFRIDCFRKDGDKEVPVKVPPGQPDREPGSAWLHDDVPKLNNDYIPRACGGGLYRLVASDDAGTKYEWEIYIPHSEVAQKSPENLADARASQTPIQQQQPQAGALPYAPPLAPVQQQTYPPQGWNPVQAHFDSRGHGLQQLPQAPQAPVAAQYSAPAAPFIPGVNAPSRAALDEMWSDREKRVTLEVERAEAEKRKAVEAEASAQKRAAEDATREAVEWRRQAEDARRQAEDAKQAAQAAAAAAQQQVAQAQHANPDVMRRLDEAERRAAESDRRAAEADRERREDQRRREDNDRLDKQLAAIREESKARMDQLEKLITTNNRPQVDPVITLLVQQAEKQAQTQLEVERIRADAEKEKARLAADLQKQQPTMRDLLVMQKELQESSGLGPVVKSMTDVMLGVTGMIKQAAETVTGLQGGGQGNPNPIMDMVGRGISEIGAAVKTGFEAKRDEAVGAANAEAVKATANARVAEAQARVVGQAVSQRQAPPAPAPAPQQQAQGQAWAPPPPVSGGFEGAPLQQASDAPQPPVPSAPADDTPEARAEFEMMREMNLFGDAMEAVKRLRTAVNNGHLDPVGAAEALQKGVAHFKGRPIKAFVMYEERTWSPLIDALLPDVPREFKFRMIQALDEISQGKAPTPMSPNGGGNGGGNGNGDGGGDPGDGAAGPNSGEDDDSTPQA